MHSPHDHIDAATTLDEVARRLHAGSHGTLKVVDGGRVIGEVTRLDLVLRGMAAGRDPRATRVHEILPPA